MNETEQQQAEAIAKAEHDEAERRAALEHVEQHVEPGAVGTATSEAIESAKRQAALEHEQPYPPPAPEPDRLATEQQSEAQAIAERETAERQAAERQAAEKQVADRQAADVEARATAERQAAERQAAAQLLYDSPEQRQARADDVFVANLRRKARGIPLEEPGIDAVLWERDLEADMMNDRRFGTTQTATFTAAGQQFAQSAGNVGNYITLSGAYTGARIGFASKRGGGYSPAPVTELTGKGTASVWNLADNGTYHFDLSSWTSDVGLIIGCPKIASGTINVNSSSGTLTSTQVLNYGPAMTPDISNGSYAIMNVTDGSAMTINAPPVQLSGSQLTFEIVNSSGGAMGVITWNATFLLSGAFNNPANTKRRTISFRWNGTNWVETGRVAADI